MMMEEGEGGEEEEEKEEESEITKEELIKQLKKMKIGKTPEDELENEVWKFMPKNIGEAVWKLMKKLWRKGRIPEEWKKEIICPIFKKDGKEDVRNYRGITLMDTAYKLYASILNERLKNEIDEKLKEGQFGFKRGRGVMDAVYVINHIVDRDREKKGKVFACFADLKTAFDRMDRKNIERKNERNGSE